MRRREQFFTSWVGQRKVIRLNWLEKIPHNCRKWRSRFASMSNFHTSTCTHTHNRWAHIFFSKYECVNLWIVLISELFWWTLTVNAVGSFPLKFPASLRVYHPRREVANTAIANLLLPTWRKRRKKYVFFYTYHRVMREFFLHGHNFLFLSWLPFMFIAIFSPLTRTSSVDWGCRKNSINVQGARNPFGEH